MTRRALMASAVAVLAAGCSQEGPPRGSGGAALRPIDGFDSPLWTGVLAPNDTVVARVEGQPITRSMLEAQLRRAGPDAEPKAVLERMIEFELLAREAFRAGHYTESVVGADMKKALARRYVLRNFEEELHPKDMPFEFVQSAYDQVKRREFDHFHLFEVVDVQVLCCMEVYDQGNCFRELDTVKERLEHLSDCIKYHEPEVRQLYERLRDARSAAEYRTRAEGFGGAFPSDALRAQFGTSAAVHGYGFEYDVNATYEAQFQDPKRKIIYRQLFKEIMDGVRTAWLQSGRKASIAIPPIRSVLGWHLLYLDRVTPERHAPVTDPAVQAEIQSHAYTPWRRVHMSRRLSELRAAYGAEEFPERLEILQQAESQVGKR